MKELVKAIQELAREFAKYNKPIVIVTDNPECQLVKSFEQRGYLVYYPDWRK